MLLGIVSDIHDQVGNLRRALSAFEAAGVDQVISLGDVAETYETGEAGVAIFELLRAAGARGVWGNHDAGLSLLWTERIREKIDPSISAFASQLSPFLVIGDCRFSHVEPWLDAADLHDLWFYDGAPDTLAKARRSFDAVEERYLFIGHFHRWLAVTPDAVLDWSGEYPLTLDDNDRYLVVIADLMHGYCATFDTGSRLLTPLTVGGGVSGG